MDALGLNTNLSIYNSDGTQFHNLVLHKFTVDSVVMSLGDKITGDVYYKDNTLTVTMSEYVEYNGVHYVLVNPPTIVREGMVSDNSEMKGMTKYNFVFYHPMYMLGNFPFNDVAVSADEQQYLSESRTFSWIGTGNDMIAKLNKNLAGTTWVVVKSDDAMSNAKLAVLSDVLSFDGQFISSALKTAYDTWEVPFVIDKLEEGQYYDGNNVDYYSQAGGSKRFVIVFGRPSNEIYEKDENGDVVLDENEEPVPFVFRMGQGVGLKNNSRTPKNNKIITRIAGYGSENNIPYGYPQIPWTGTGAEADWDYTINNTSGMQTITVGGRTIQAMSYPIYDGIVGGQRVRLIKHPFTRTHLMPTVFAETVDKKVNPKNPNYDPDTIIKDYYDATSPTYVNPIVLDAPCYEVHQFEKIKPQLGEKRIVGVLPYEEEDANSMTVAQFTLYINELILQYGGITARYLTEMLEAFNVTPHVDADRGYVGGSYTYEWHLKFSGNYCTAFYGSPVLEFQKTVKMSNQEITWDDTMDDDGNYKQSYFKLTLPVLGFDLYACAAITEEMNIVMRGGACIGCTFPVQVDWDDYKKNFYDAEGNFDPAIGTGHPRNSTKYPDSTSASITVIVQKDNTTFGTLKPNIYQQPHGESSTGANDGDKFVITGISMPTSYITSAQTELDEAMMEYMLENNVYYYEYPLKFDEYFFATNTQILEQIRTNTIFRFLFGSDVVPKALYAKEITVKYGDGALPKYDITLTDDIEIVLNQIGQVTDDVSKMRVQLSDLMAFYGVDGGGIGVDYNTLAQALAEKLSKVSDDVARGKITFQNGIETLGRAIFGGELTSNGFVSGMDSTGRGWRIDQQGNAEMESLRVRSYLEVIELLINRLQAQEGDTLFTDNDQITYVEEKTYNENTYYKLTLKEKWDGYVTAQKADNILKGIVNTLAANAGNVSDVTESQCVETDGGNKYYTSWMKVVDPSLYGDTVGTNQICVVLFGDASTPAGKNFAPCELMNIARFGCTANPNASGLTPAQKADIERRQRLFTISTTDGRITKLRGVNSPILNEGNYGTTLGIIPDFINDWSIADRLIAGRDYLYAQGVIVGDFIKVDVNGEPIVNYVDCGEWVDGSQVETPTVGEGIYLVNEYNETNLQWETHDVWHNNAKWRCLMHQPYNGVYYEPNETNVTYWEKLMEGTEGGDGKSHATVAIFKRIAGTPSSSDKPTATLYYKFADGKLYTKSGDTYTLATTELNGWTRDIPAHTSNPCYQRQVNAIGSDDYFEIQTGDWSDAIEIVEDGRNAIHVDLSNEHEDFIYSDNIDSNNGRVSDAVTSQACLYDGSQEVTTGISWSVCCGQSQGVDVWTEASNTFTIGTIAKAKISTSGLLTVDQIYQKTSVIKVRAEYPSTNGSYYYAVFTANKTSQDKYELLVKPNSIPYNPATFTTKTVALSATRLDLSGTKSSVVFGQYIDPISISTTSNKGFLRLFVTYKKLVSGSASTVTEQVISSSFSITAGTNGVADLNTDLYFELRKYANYLGDNTTSYVICDYETMPINKAESGESAFIVDLNPEMTSVALQEGDLVNDVDLYFYPRAYYGSTPVINDCTISASTTVPGVNPTPDDTNHKVRVQISSGTGLPDATEISVTVTHSTYGSRTVTFIIAGVNSGDNGDPAVLRELDPSRNVISFKRLANGNLDPASRSLTLQFKKTVGDVCSNETIAASGLTVKYSFDSMPASSSSGYAWGTSDGTTGTSWSSGTLTIQSGIAETNLYIAAFNSDGVLVDRETIPIVKDGDNGDDGLDAAVAFASPASISIPCNTSGNVISQVSKTITFTLRIGGQEVTPTSVSNNTPPTGVNVTGVYQNVKTIEVTTSASASGMATGVTFTASVTYNGVNYSAMVTVALIGSLQGVTGTGKMGRNYYYKGNWNDFSSSSQFSVTDAEAPYFSYNGNYYVYNPTTNGTYTKSSMGTPSNTAPWYIMVTDFKYLITEATFSNFAKLGSAIFNLDFMFSQYLENGMTMFSGSYTRNATSYVIVPNQTSLRVVEGQRYTIKITCSCTSGYTSTGLLVNVYYNTNSDWSGSTYNGKEKLHTALTSPAIYDLNFTAEYTGYVRIYAYGYGTITNIASATSETYEKVSPLFLNTDKIPLLVTWNNSTSSTSYSNIVETEIPITSGRTYELTFNGYVSGGTGYVGVYYGGAIKHSTSFTNRQSAAQTLTFTATSTTTAFVRFRISSSSSTIYVDSVYIRCKDAFVPKVVVDWLSGYSHFGGDSVRFNPDGSGHLAGGNLKWDDDGIIHGRGYLHEVVTYWPSNNYLPSWYKYTGNTNTYFKKGKYYKYDELTTEQKNWYSSNTSYFSICTGYADTVNYTARASGNVTEALKLPDPEDMKGLAVDMYTYDYGSGYGNRHTFVVGSVASTNVMVLSVYPTTSTNPKLTYYQTYNTFTGSFGMTYRFMSIYVEDKSKWVWWCINVTALSAQSVQADKAYVLNS